MQRAQQKKRKQQQAKEQRRVQQRTGDGATVAMADAEELGQHDVVPDDASAAEATATAVAESAGTAAAASGAPAVAARAAHPTASRHPQRKPAATAANNPYVRVKPGNFSRLLYTNPVCLLTTSVPPSAAAAAATPAASSATTADGVANNSSSSAALASADAAAASSSSPSSRVLPRRNVMTISWLTATSNHGEFVCSMHAGRYSAQLLAQQTHMREGGNPVASAAGAASTASAAPAAAAPAPSLPFVGAYFVLSVPVAGMEELVRSIGGCSGADADGALEDRPPATADGKDKFARLGIKPVRPGNKPISPAADVVPSAFQSGKQAGGGRGGGQGGPAKEQLFDEQAADAEDQALDLVAVPDCAAYLVCKVESSCPASDQPTPRVQAHNVLFCRVQRAYVHRSYWINGNNFAPSTPHTPPYLTFLGSGKFGHVVLPEHAAWARMSHEPLYSQAH